MRNISNFINLVDDDVNIHSTDSIAGASSRMVGVTSTAVSSGWVPFPGLLLVVGCWLFVYYFIRQLIFCRFFVCYSFGTGDLSVVVTKMRKYIESNVGFRYIPMKQYFCESSRGSLPGVLANSYLDTTI